MNADDAKDDANSAGRVDADADLVRLVDRWSQLNDDARNAILEIAGLL